MAEQLAASQERLSSMSKWSEVYLACGNFKQVWNREKHDRQDPNTPHYSSVFILVRTALIKLHTYVLVQSMIRANQNDFRLHSLTPHLPRSSFWFVLYNLYHQPFCSDDLFISVCIHLFHTVLTVLIYSVQKRCSSA
jgi:hypothetical protein